MADIFVGNPPQPVMAVFDTGSTNAFVMGPVLHKKLAEKNQPKLAQIQQ